MIDYAEPVLTLSEPVDFDDAGTHYVVLRRKDGSLSGPWMVSAGGSDCKLQLMEGSFLRLPILERRTHTLLLWCPVNTGVC